jgi:hypothetical protein
LAAILLLGTMVGCAGSTKPIPELTFAHEPAIDLNVRQIETVSRYQASTNPPYVDHQMRTPPETLLRRWASERLRAGGSTGIGRFTILSAPVTVEQLPKKTGFTGVFAIEQDQRYTVTVEAQLEILDEGGRRLGGTLARATNSRTLAEGASAEERDVFFSELTTSVMNAFNTDMDRSIRQHLRDWTF